MNFGPLNLEFTTMIWRSFMCKMREIIETRSILGTGIRQWMAGTAERICAKFTRKTCLVIRSDEFECQGQRLKVKVTTGQKTRCALTTPPRCARNRTPSLQVTSRKQQTRRLDRCRGVSSPGCVRWVWPVPLGSATHF